MNAVLLRVGGMILCMVGAGVAACFAEGEETELPWPMEVKGWKAPEGGEHPRLFFRKSDIPKLRKRAQTPEGKAIIKRLRQLLDGDDGEDMPPHKNPMTSAYGKSGGPRPGKKDLPIGTYSISHAAGYGFLYVLTGDKKYAELGKKCFEWAFEGVRDRDREARYSFRKPGGALRAGPSLGWYAVGYDLCYDGWSEDFRLNVAKALSNYNEGRFMSLEELAQGKRHMPASNHWGMQVGGAALALLALWKDPGVDNGKIERLMEKNARCMIRNVTEGFGDHGWFAEGDGTGSMSSQIAYLPGIQAWRVAGGKDFATPRPNVPWTVLKWIFLTIARGGRMDFPKRGAYPHNVWARTTISGAGYFCEGFGIATPAQKAALLWFYNHYLKEVDEKNGTPFDTTSPYPHHAILSLVNWPFGMEEMNPARCIPRAVRDKKFGFYMFRNRWKDKKDTVISIQTRNTRGWHRAKTDGSIWIWALGKKTTWGRVRTDVTYWKPAGDGSAILTGADGTCLGIDFSGASGAGGMLVMTGPGAGSGAMVDLGGETFSFYFITQGEVPRVEVVENKIVVGKQTVWKEDGNIVLGKMVGPWKGPDRVSAGGP